jgi:hypothetical protein
MIDRDEVWFLLFLELLRHVGWTNNTGKIGNLNPVQHTDFGVVTSKVPSQGSMGGKGIIKAAAILSPLGQGRRA